MLLLLFTLFLNSLKRMANSALILSYSLISILAVGYFWYRSEGNGGEAPFASIVLDSLSFYGRSLGLFWFSFAGIYLVFHQGLSLKRKVKFVTLLLFFFIFFDALFLSKTILMYWVTWVGGLFALGFMIVLESEEGQIRSALLRQSAVMAMVVGLVSILFNFFSDSKDFALILGWIISFGYPMSSVQIRSFLAKSPLAQAWFFLWIYFSGGVFWIRFGLPLLNDQMDLIGFMFSLTALHAALVSVRTSNGAVWLGSTLLALVHLSWFSLLVNLEQGVSLFYLIGMGSVPLFTFAGYAFHLESPYLKRAKVAVTLGLIGFLPFVTANLYFSLLSLLIEHNFLIFAGVCILVWFLLCVSATQQIGTLMVERKSREQGLPYGSLLLFIFLVTIIAMAGLKQPLLQLLNHRPNL